MEEQKRRKDFGVRAAKEAAWRQRIEHWKRSGLTQAAFCRQRGLSIANFHWWRKRLSARNGEPRLEGRAFVPVRLKEEALSAGARWRDTWSCEVICRCGVKIRLRKRPSAAWLNQLANVLAGAGR